MDNVPHETGGTEPETVRPEATRVRHSGCQHRSTLTAWGVVALSVWMMLSSAPLAAQEVTYTDPQGNVMTFQLGDAAFADKEVSYEPGNRAGEPGDYEPIAGEREGELALGPPDFEESKDKTATTLGCSGELVLQFTDNVLVDQPGPDLHIFEVGPDVEGTSVAISADRENWVELGQVEGGEASLDIAEAIDTEEIFRFVRLIDDGGDGGDCRSRTPGADIDAVGALNAAQMVQLEGNLLFDTDSSRLRTEARKALARIAAKLREAKVEEATIVGHTDAQGAADYNRRLSLNRAKAVRQHLVEQLELTGLEMTVRGAGETQPVASNETAEGRRLNRRVEIIF